MNEQQQQLMIINIHNIFLIFCFIKQIDSIVSAQ